MSGKNIYSDGEQNKKSNFHKNKKLFNVYDINVGRILISKKELYGKKTHSNTLLEIMMMMMIIIIIIMSSGYYVLSFIK